MQIDIHHVARLARLALSDEEAARLGEQLGRILDYVSELEGLDTDGVAPTTHVLPVSTPLRADEVTGVLTREEALSQAPVHDDEAFIVPKVVG